MQYGYGGQCACACSLLHLRIASGWLLAVFFWVIVFKIEIANKHKFKLQIDVIVLAGMFFV